MRNMKKIATTSICSVSTIIGIVLTNYSDEIRTSKTGLEIIGNAESCIREPYYCPANILTVGIGSTGSVEQKRYTYRVKGCYLFYSNYSCYQGGRFYYSCWGTP